VTLPRILVVDDESNQREMLAEHLTEQGFHATPCAGGEEALRYLGSSPVDVVLTDLRMPGMGGSELLRRVKETSPSVEVVVMTAFGTVASAVEAMKCGAYDYLTKPLDLERMIGTIRRALERTGLVRELARLRERLGERIDVDGIVADSRAMQDVLRLAARVAPSAATVMLTGESGTGKEVVARLIHAQSPRGDGLFIAANVAAIPRELVEAELFGHTAGAFTGARQDRAGLFEEARGGTLLLDEIGEMPLDLQPKLLRILQDRRVTRVGESRERLLDVRILAATNRDLEAVVREGAFREDLYYRLNVVRIRIPPLRERREDIAPLARIFLDRFAQRDGRSFDGLTREAHDLLLGCPWPGNVRELKNAIERAVVLATGDRVSAADLPDEVRSPLEATVPVPGLLSRTLAEAMDDLERSMIRAALERTAGIQTRAAEILGTTERRLRYRMKRLGL
jgi:DNA-binding NtrC family response regulator